MKEDSSVLFHVQLVHDAVNKGGQDKRRGPDKEQPGKQGIRRREQFPHVGCNRINRPHTPEDHGRVHKSVNPWQATEIVVAQYADTQSHAHQSSRNAHKQDDPPKEAMAGQEWIATMLEHAPYRNAGMASTRSRGAA